MTPTVVLVRPARQGNVGGAARAMANMGLADLVLVEPAVAIGDEARAFAFGAGHVLDAARRVPSLGEALGPFARVVGTTAARERELSTPLVTPRELPAHLAGDAPTALVFGPESSGLTADELARCTLLVRIPSSAVQPSLNLAQAVLVIGYELFQARTLADQAAAAPRLRQADAPAAQAEVEGLLAHARELLTAAGFARDSSFAGVERDLRALASRSALTTHEVRVLRGVCRRLGHALARAARPDAAEPGDTVPRP